jgi:hypothetical protein
MEVAGALCLITRRKGDSVAGAKVAGYIHDRDAKTRKLVTDFFGKPEIPDRDHLTTSFDGKLAGNHVLTGTKAKLR